MAADDPGPATGPRPRDAVVVARALRAGLLTWGLTGGSLVAASVLLGGGGRLGLLAVTMGLVAGSLVASGWLLLAGILDLLAGHLPGRRRLLWTAGVVLFTFLSPVLVLGAAGGAAG